MGVEVKNIYSTRANERRRQFNNLINNIDMVLINKIPEIDDSIWDNFENEYNFMGSDCYIEESDTTPTKYYCTEHNKDAEDAYACEDYEDATEVYQWFAINQQDASFLSDHKQHVTYSTLLDTYFLAITHFGTSWDYVESMVGAFEDCYQGLEDFNDEER